mgnify:CR=1 FL=1
MKKIAELKKAMEDKSIKGKNIKFFKSISGGYSLPEEDQSINTSVCVNGGDCSTSTNYSGCRNTKICAY